MIGNPDEYGTTALMYAAKKWNLKCCAMLLEAGAPINQQSQMSQSPLIYACFHAPISLRQKEKQLGLLHYFFSVFNGDHVYFDEAKEKELKEERKRMKRLGTSRVHTDNDIQVHDFDHPDDKEGEEEDERDEEWVAERDRIAQLPLKERKRWQLCKDRQNPNGDIIDVHIIDKVLSSKE